jgi:hypothetical protein
MISQEKKKALIVAIEKRQVLRLATREPGGSSNRRPTA